MKRRTACLLSGCLWCFQPVLAEPPPLPDPGSRPGYGSGTRPTAPIAGQPLDAPSFLRMLQEGEADPAAPAGETHADLETAILLIQDQEHEAAIPLLERALQERPTVEPIWEALGWSYHYSGRSDEAKSLWEQYLALRPDSPKGHSLLGQLAILRSDWRSADIHLRDSLALDPSNYDIRYWYAQNLFRLGRLEASFSLLEALIREDEFRYDVKIDLARICTLTQRYEQAADLWTDIVDEIPENLNFRTEFARALLLVGSIEEADEQAQRILAEDNSLWPVMNLRADVAELSQDPERMVESLLELIEEAEDEEVKTLLRVRLASRYIMLNRKDAERWPLTLPLEQYEKVIEQEPDNVPWLNQYAQIALMARQTRATRKALDRILKDINPYNRQALRTRFELELLLQNYAEAERTLDEIQDRYVSGDPFLHLDRARLEVQQGRYQNALDALERLEEAGNRGTVLTLLYHGLTESEWMAMTSTRRIEEHLLALRNAGFTFIAPQDIATVLGNVPPPRERPPRKPWLARQVDSLRYAFTGRRETTLQEEIRPKKIAVVTFDDGLRSSFLLGTPIAQELGVPFGMFVITKLEELNAPMYASWEEIADYRNAGVWEIGSHLHHAHTPLPAGKEPHPEVHPLPNRLWVPERNRLETMREWTQRVRNEFSLSRAILEEHLGLEPGTPLAVAYPYGNIGQEEDSNVSHVLNPLRTILNEASRNYQIGFVLDRFGYTSAGENLLVIRRYEPTWDEEAQTVVDHAFQNHPVFIARRTRAEIATLMQRPYLAERQIELLRRDGYPEHLLRNLIAFTQHRSPDGIQGAALDDPDRPGARRTRIAPSNAYLAGTYHETQSSEQILLQQFELRGGLNLNALTGLEALYRFGRVDQVVVSNILFQVNQSESFASRVLETRTENGTTETSETITQTTNTREVYTNRMDRYEYAADVEEIRFACTLRLSDQATLGMTLGQKSLSITKGRNAESSDGSELVGSLTVAWKPYRPLQLIAAFERDVVPSARRLIAYDSFALNSLWKVSDEWDVSCNARYWNYEDSNAMVHVFASSFWKLLDRHGIWGGLEASIYSMDDHSDYYWTPYWDTRYAGVFRFQRAYLDYFFQFDIRLGFQNEKARPEDVLLYRNLRARAESDGNWYPGDDPNPERDFFVGLGGSYRQRLYGSLDLLGSLTVNFLRDYSEHTFSLGLQYNF